VTGDNGGNGDDGVDGGGRTAARQLRGLIVDWGGVLTAPLSDAMLSWAKQENVPIESFNEVMRSWLGSPAMTSGSDLNEPVAPPDPPLNSPVHDLERGLLSPQEFEVILASELRKRGAEVSSDGLLTRILAGLAQLHDDMLGLVRKARREGIKTALLSNSWGEHYPEHQWAGAFDAVVISGRVGMRKPDREIFVHTAELLGLDVAECVMVDDLPRNVEAAVAAGMVGVLHSSYDETKTELDILLGLAPS
jgi:HAD superfamily hydrolase (TIGR01509 family)